MNVVIGKITISENLQCSSDSPDCKVNIYTAYICTVMLVYKENIMIFCKRSYYFQCIKV